MLLLTACSNGISYDYSVDVNSSEWTPTDTLFFPIRVEPLSASYSLLESGHPYRLSLAVRYERHYPAIDLPLHFQMEKSYTVSLPLGDSLGIPDGYGNGSLYVKEFDVSQMAVTFPDSGNYMLKIWPDTTLSDILSITATLE